MSTLDCYTKITLFFDDFNDPTQFDLNCYEFCFVENNYV